MTPPNNPCRSCTPEQFRTLYRLDARLSLQTDRTLFLAVLRAPTPESQRKLVEHLQKNLFHGELYCEMEPCVTNLLMLTADEAHAQVILDDITDELPEITARLTSVMKE